MTTTYTGVLRNNHIEWTPPAPPALPDGVRVQVTLLDSIPDVATRGQRMAAALERLAASKGVASIADPLQWEREVREDRELPGRD